MEKFYITTPIYYPSGKFHIGTAYTEICADTMARYKRLKGYDVRFLTGLDEHGQKIETVAKEKGKTPKEYVDEVALYAKNLWKTLNISYDDFIRTTESRHEEIVKKIFDKFMESGDIYKGEYKGMYCMPCESYFTESQLIDGKCPDCHREVKEMKEEAYFFNMKKYADRLIKFYEENPDFISPESRKNEMLNNFLKPGLEDLCVSRTSFEWGIKVAKDPKHVVYVWLDALTNYITALGFMSDDETLFNKYWPADVHMVGKDIVRFHAIYWPIFLMALDLPLPKKIFAHGFIMMKDGKMSKSKGNVVYPDMLAEKYGVDATRYFLLRDLPYGQDGIFTPEAFIERYNFDLCNDLSNLLNRTVSMMNKYLGGIIPKYTGCKNDSDEELEVYAKEQVLKAEEALNKYEFNVALTEIWNLVSKTNKYIDETSPWSLAKNEEKEKLDSVMYHLAENLRKIAILIKPFMPDTSDKMFRELGMTFENFDSIYEYDKIKENTKVSDTCNPMFMRLNMDDEVNYIKEKMAGK